MLKGLSAETQTQVPRRTLDWLLEPRNPVVRFQTATMLLNRKEVHPDLSKDPWVRYLFKGQKEHAYWESKSTCYDPKYGATVWRLLVLADLGAAREDARVRNAVEFFLDLHKGRDGGFSCAPSPASSHSCLTGNMTRALLRFGYLDDERTWQAIDWLLDMQLPDGGWNCFMDEKPSHSSFNSTWEPLSALLELPFSKRTRRIREAIDEATSFLVRHRVYRSCRTGALINRNWLKLFYPPHNHYSFLTGLALLAKQGIRDDMMRESIELLHSKATRDRRWSSELAFRGTRKRMGGLPLQLEPAGLPSKWLTLQALLTLTILTF